MEKERSFKVIAVIALCLAVVGVTIGFAAFTTTLRIENASATVKKGSNDNFDIHYTGTVSCTPSGSTEITETGESATGGYVKGTASGLSWSGIKATLYEPGDKLTCTAGITNESIYTAYLNEISTSAGITCNGSAANTSDVCSALKSTVSIGDSSLDITSTAATNNNITANTIAASSSGNVTFVIEYQSTGPIADDDVTVTIPTINLKYDTAEL